MRINHTKRIFMNEEGGSPGGGSPPAPAAPPAVPTAPETPAALTPDQVKGLVGEQLKAFQNEFFANARKAGLLGKEKPADPPTPPQSSPAAAPASTGLSMTDVQALLDRNTVLTRVQIENKLSDAQVKRMRSALETERPDDPGSWATTYLADMGLVRTTETATQVIPVPQPQPNGHPISDKGSPAPGGVVNWERELAENPIGMSAAARAAMDAKHGAEKARKMRLEAAQSQAQRIRVTPI